MFIIDHETASMLQNEAISLNGEQSCGISFSLAYLIARKCVDYVHEHGIATKDPVILGTKSTIDHTLGVAAQICPALRNSFSDYAEHDCEYMDIESVGCAVGRYDYAPQIKTRADIADKKEFTCYETLAFCGFENKLYRFGCDAAMELFGFDWETGEIDYINPNYL